MSKNVNLITLLKAILALLVVFILLPYLNIIFLILKPNSDYLNFIIKHGVLTKYILNTIELILKVGIITSILGFIGAYFMVFYSFKFKKIINLLFILPLSIPVYVGAYVYSDIYNRIPFLKFLLKNEFTMNSSVFIYVIFLYPYIYLTTYSYLKNHMQEYIEAAQMLKLSNFKILYKVIFPLSKTIVFSSSLFVIYESLSDFAVTEYFGTSTLSKAFNDSWRVTGEPATSAKLALFLMLIIGAIILFEKFLRSRSRTDSMLSVECRAINPSFKVSLIIYTFYSVIILIGFILPFHRIIVGALNNYEYFFKRNILTVTLQTFTLSLYVIAIIIVLGMFLTAMLKYMNKRNRKRLSIISTLGYMIPSMILSLGVYSFFFDLDVLSKTVFSTFIFTTTRFALIIGLSLKFLAIAYNNYELTYAKLNPSIFEAGLMLKQNPIKSFFRIDLHFLLKTSKYISILVVLDVFKELTLAFNLSPFNSRTVSMEIYRYMANEMQQVAYVPSFIIVVLCSVCIIVLERGILNDKNRKFDF